MPLYTAITQEGTVSAETRAKMAKEITHCLFLLMLWGAAAQLCGTRRATTPAIS